MQTTTRPIRTGHRAPITVHVELTPVPRTAQYRVQLAGKRSAHDVGTIVVTADESGWDWSEYPSEPLPECVMELVMRAIDARFRRPNG